MALSGPIPGPRRGAVLIGFAEASAAPEAAWSLLDAGFEVVACARRGRRGALRHARAVTIADVTAPEADAAACAADVARIASQIGAVAAMPLDDAAVWVWDRAFLGNPRMVAGATGASATLALDKRWQAERARAAGFQVPEWRAVARPADVAGWSRFPCVLKPALAVRLDGVRLGKGSLAVCEDAASLARAAAELTGAEPMMLQEFVPKGVGEGLFGFVAEGGLRAVSAHRRVRMINPRGSGSSACVSIAADPVLRAAAERMLVGAGWRGLFMIEMLRAEGGAWFMELNGRAWGSMALARRCGFEYPAWAVEQAIDRAFTPPEPAPAPGLLCRNLGLEAVHLLTVLRGPRDGRGREDWPSPWATLRDVLRVRGTDRWYNWRRGESRVFLADAWRSLADRVFKTRSGA